MQRHPIANTYARALLAVAEERGEIEQYAEELRSLTADVFADAGSRVFLESPKIPRREKKDVIARALEGKVSVALSNLLMVLIDRNRQTLLDEIAEAYGDLCDDVAGRTHAYLTSAAPLHAASRDQLMATLNQKLKREIVAHEKVDEDLLGGMTIRIGDVVVDGSVRSRLNEIREQIASRRLGSDLIDED